MKFCVSPQVKCWVNNLWDTKMQMHSTWGGSAFLWAPNLIERIKPTKAAAIIHIKHTQRWLLSTFSPLTIAHIELFIKIAIRHWIVGNATATSQPSEYPSKVVWESGWGKLPGLLRIDTFAINRSYFGHVNHVIVFCIRTSSAAAPAPLWAPFRDPFRFNEPIELGSRCSQCENIYKLIHISQRVNTFDAAC